MTAKKSKFLKLVVDEGCAVVEGEPLWPDVVRVYFSDPEHALYLAEQLMSEAKRQVQNSGQTKGVFGFALSGKLSKDK